MALYMTGALPFRYGFVMWHMAKRVVLASAESFPRVHRCLRIKDISHAAAIQHQRGYHFVSSFHREVVRGVATYVHELFNNRADLRVVLCRSAWALAFAA
jgi:hypothetical protein